MRAALAAVGAFGFAAQVVLLRELLSVFSGNELSAGLMVGTWILCEALGALLGTGLRAGFGWTAAVSVVATLAAVPAAVLAPRMFGLLPAETAGVAALAGITLAVVLVPAFSHGFLFTLGAHALGARGSAASAPARAYVWEGMGTAAAAIMVSFWLLPRFSSLAMLALFGLPVAAAVIAVGRVRPARLAAGLLVAAICVLLLSGRARGVERWAYSRLWPGQRVARVAESHYGRLVVLEREGQSVVFASGTPVFAAPLPDPSRVEGLVHLPLLVHPRPRRVLLVGQGLAGCLHEALKHPLDHVATVQLDPALVRLVRAAGGDALAADLADPRVRLHTADPRVWLLRSADTFDVIILADAAPASLAANRLFSVEFLGLCRRRLAAGGVFACPAPGSVDHLAGDAAASLATRVRTLRRVFPEVRTLYADLPLVLASGSVPCLDPETLAGRLAALRLTTAVLDSGYLAGLLDPFRQRQAGRWLPDPDAAPVNSDLNPVELRLSMTRAGQVAASFFARLYRGLAGLPPTLSALPGLLLLAVALLAARRRGFALRFCILTSGFAGAALSTLLLYGYAVRFGSAYSGAALLIGAFMVGNVGGAALGRVAGPATRSWFAAGDVALVAAAAAVPLLCRGGPAALFPAVAGLAGAAVGTQFAAAGRALGGTEPGRAAGRLYGLDLVGGCAGGILAAIFLVPVWGLAGAAAAVAATKLAGAVSQYLGPGPARASD
ncbi:hypothetical protein FJY71_04390 [candidate division WOR-3 bacterium]|nr:hypothetical protein [candidate division WOR-3 bacterium]